MSDHTPSPRYPGTVVGEKPFICKDCDGYLCFGEDGLGELMHVRDLPVKQ